MYLRKQSLVFLIFLILIKGWYQMTTPTATATAATAAPAATTTSDQATIKAANEESRAFMQFLSAENRKTSETSALITMLNSASKGIEAAARK